MEITETNHKRYNATEGQLDQRTSSTRMCLPSKTVVGGVNHMLNHVNEDSVSDNGNGDLEIVSRIVVAVWVTVFALLQGTKCPYSCG